MIGDKMRKTLFALIFISALALTSCGKTVETVSSEAAVTTTATTTKTTAATTTAATTVTTKTVKTDPPESAVLTARSEVEVYSDMTVGELIIDTNTTLKEPDALIDTDGLGEKKIKVAFTYEGDEYEKEIAYSITDTTPPLALNMGWSPYTKVGEPFDLNKIIGYVDNYDRAPQATYTGTVDTSAVGSFPISVTVTDSSGNQTSWDMTVLVLNEIPKDSYEPTPFSFADFMAYYDYDNVSYGIDVSAWQSVIDFGAVRDAGCEFALIRCGYYYSSFVEDDYFRRNISGAADAGLDVGIYFYTTDNTEEGVRANARHIIELLDGRKLDYPIAFDWEEWSTFQEYGMNIRDLNNVFEAFCDEVEKHGYSAMLYSSKNFLNSVWENRNDHPVWLAHYVDETDYEGKYAIWQQSSSGKIPGIDGFVDMNIRYNSMPLK